jgi:hypothetical protein
MVVDYLRQHCTVMAADDEVRDGRRPVGADGEPGDVALQSGRAHDDRDAVDPSSAAVGSATA